MGDRASISFKQGNYESVSLFNHWGGIEFFIEAQRYADNLIKRKEGKSDEPLDRLEPMTVMVDFIRYLTKNMDEVNSNLYLGVDRNDGDNSDNGHRVIELPDK